MSQELQLFHSALPYLSLIVLAIVAGRYRVDAWYQGPDGSGGGLVTGPADRGRSHQVPSRQIRHHVAIPGGCRHNDQWRVILDLPSPPAHAINACVKPSNHFSSPENTA
jgi:hypothetical protein